MAYQVFDNARVYTANGPGSWAGAMGVEDGRFAAVGSSEEVRAAAPPGALVTDLGGRTVVPGLIDAHNHFLQTSHCLTWIDARYPGVATVAGLVALIGQAAASTPAGSWIQAFGLDPAKLPDGPPTRFDLDRATADHRVLVRHVSGHHALVNSAALLQRVGEDAADPQGGQLMRDGDGRLNGWCLDSAMQLILPVAVDVGHHGPNIHFEAPMEDLVGALPNGSREYLAAGITTVCDAQVSRRELAAYREARRQGTLGIRVVCMPLSHQLDAFLATGVAGPLGDDRLAIGPMKFYADGALSGNTACFRTPYGQAQEFAGILYHEPEELNSLIARAQGDGWQVGIHAQGDRAIEMSLDAIAAGATGAGGRHRIEHAGYPADQLERIASLGVIPVSQPGYLHDFGDTFLAVLGERAHDLLPLRTELELGITVVLSSDSFVTTYKPLHHIAAAVNRRTRTGQSIGADQALTVEEAIRGYTIDAARSFFAEDRLGSIEPGKLADFVVFESDPFAGSPAGLAETGIRMTVLGGDVAYESTGT